MNVELTREDLKHLLKGTTPNYNVMDSPFVKANGSYTGGHKDEWNWNYDAGDKMTEQQLWDTYVLCRDSWAKKEEPKQMIYKGHCIKCNGNDFRKVDLPTGTIEACNDCYISDNIFQTIRNWDGK